MFSDAEVEDVVRRKLFWETFVIALASYIKYEGASATRAGTHEPSEA